MGYPLPKLTRQNQHKFFGYKVNHGDLFNYSQSFLFRDVEILARKHGFWVEYCKPDTKEYKMHGDMTCYVYSIAKAADEMERNSWDTKEGSLGEAWEAFTEKLTGLVDKFEEKKEEAAKVRDDLREIADEITEIVESFDDGVEGLEVAIETFRHSIDDMSRYV